MEQTVKLSGKGGYNLGLGLGRGYDAPQPHNNKVVTIDNNLIQRSKVWLKEFQSNGVGGGISNMMNLLLSENNGMFPMRPGADGFTGPAISREQFNNEVLVPLLITYTGLLMNTKQYGGLKALTTLMSVIHLPETIPMQRPDFLMRFKQHGQILAKRGKMTTKTGSVGSEFHDVIFSLDKYLAGFNIGDLEFFYDKDPSQIIEALSEKMESLETTWGLTTIFLHAAYAARQPSLQQLILMNRALHQPRDNGLGRMMQIFFMEHLLMGAVNRDSSNLPQMLASVTEMMRNTAGEVLVLVPQRVMDSGSIKTNRKVVAVHQDKYIYNSNRPNGMEGYGLFGVSRKDPGSDYAAISDKKSITYSIRAPHENITDKGPLDLDQVVEVDALTLSNGQECTMIMIDGTLFDIAQDSSCDAPLKHNGVKKLFFTVGAPPSSYQDFANPGFFTSRDGSGISPKTVTESSPGISYFMDFDNNKIAKISLVDIHGLIGNANLFDDTLAFGDWERVFNRALMGYVDEPQSGDLLLVPQKTRQASPLMMYETNPRYMVVRDQVDIAAHPNRLVAGAEYIYYKQREIMGNASPCHSFDVDIVGVVGGLIHLFGDSIPNLLGLMDQMAIDLEQIDVAVVRNFRGLDISQLNMDAILRNLKLIVENRGILSDPVCQILFLQLMNRATSQSLNPATQNEKDIIQYVATNTNFLKEREQNIRKTMREVEILLKSLFNETEFNLILHGKPLIAIAASNQIGDNFIQYIKFMYGIVLPSLTSAVLTPDADRLNNVLERNEAISGMSQFPVTAVFVNPRYPVPSNYEIVHPYNIRGLVRLFVTRPIFFRRYNELMKRFGTMPIITMFGLVHWWTHWNIDTMERHFDKRYYSGLSYLVVRHLKFKGYTMSCLPVQGTRFLVGNRAAAFPVSSWQNTEYKQTLEMGLAPMDLSHLGITLPNIYVDEINGLGDNFDINNADANLIFDSYNSFLPEGLNNHQPELSMLSAQGKYDAHPNTRDLDTISDIFTQLPTSFFKTSSIFRNVQNLVPNPSEDSSIGLMDQCLKTSSFINGVPGYVISALESGLSGKKIIDQVVDSSYLSSSIFNPQFSGLFTDDYTIGFGSSIQFRRGDINLNQDLTPRISSMGGLNANAIFGNTSQNTKFMNAFIKQVSAAKLNMGVNF